MTKTEMMKRYKEASYYFLILLARKLKENHGVEIPKKVIDDIKFDFSLKGRTGGYAQGHKELHYNLVMASLNDFDEVLNVVVPHECAHIIASAMVTFNPTNRLCRNYSGHGSLWKKLMGYAGKAPKRCHNFKVEKARLYTKYKYVCNCGCESWVTSKIHNKIQSGQARYFCKKHKSLIQFTGDIEKK